MPAKAVWNVVVSLRIGVLASCLRSMRNEEAITPGCLGAVFHWKHMLSAAAEWTDNALRFMSSYYATPKFFFAHSCVGLWRTCHCALLFVSLLMDNQKRWQTIDTRFECLKQEQAPDTLSSSGWKQRTHWSWRCSALSAWPRWMIWAK